MKSTFANAKGMVTITKWRAVQPLKGLRLRERWAQWCGIFVPDRFICECQYTLGENAVVDNSVKQMARLLGGLSQSDRYINRMQFGTGAAAAADAADTALETPISPIKTISSTSYPTDRSVRFQAFLLEDEANGFPLREAGLLFANTSPLLATRKTFEALTKSSDFVFEWNWTIYWA